ERAARGPARGGAFDLARLLERDAHEIAAAAGRAAEQEAVDVRALELGVVAPVAARAHGRDPAAHERRFRAQDERIARTLAPALDDDLPVLRMRGELDGVEAGPGPARRERQAREQHAIHLEQVSGRGRGAVEEETGA